MLVLPIFLLRHLPTRLGIRRRAVSTGYSREHGACSQRIAGVALTLLGVELAALRRRIPLPFGASCLVVASPLDSGR